MRVTVIALAGLLALQLGLAGVLQWSGGGPAVDGQAQLASFDTGAVERIRIAGSDGATLEVVRAEGGWRLPASDDFPATADRADRLLADLKGLTGRLPVARSDQARSRFGVAEDDFERRVRLQGAEETLATVYLGNAAGAGQVYARAAGDDMIYEVDFAIQQAAVAADAWYDKAVARVPVSEVETAALPAVTLRRADKKDGGWRLVDAEGETARPDPVRVDKLLRRAAQPDFTAVSRAPAPDAEPSVTYELTTRDGDSVTYRYFAADGESKAQFRRGDMPWSFRAPAKQMTAIRDAARKTLTAEAPPGGKPGPVPGKSRDTAERGVAAGSASSS